MMPVRRRPRDEDGATLVVVALALVVVFGMASLVIDLGSGWRARRGLIPATDAVALAAAQNFVETGAQPNDCTRVGGVDYLTANAPSATLAVDCAWGGTDDHGWVTVTANDTAPTWFAGILGFGDITVESTSSALWAPPETIAGGLRPMAACVNSDPIVATLITTPLGRGDPPVTLRVPHDNTTPNCPTISGNWGWIDFNGGGGGVPELRNWIRNGYDGSVTWENHTVTACTGDPHCYPGETGNKAGTSDALNDLLASGETFLIPVYNFADGTGSNARFHFIGVLPVKLTSFAVNGPPSGRHFEYQVQPGAIVSGTCCGVVAGSGGLKTTAICGVEPGQTAGCRP